MSIRKRIKPYWLNVLLAIDQLGSAIVGYDADTSISSALGEVQWLEYQGNNIGWRHPLKALLQRSLDEIQENHCLKAYIFDLRQRNLSYINVKNFLDGVDK